MHSHDSVELDEPSPADGVLLRVVDPAEVEEIPVGIWSTRSNAPDVTGVRGFTTDNARGAPDFSERFFIYESHCFA